MRTKASSRLSRSCEMFVSTTFHAANAMAARAGARHFSFAASPFIGHGLGHAAGQQTSGYRLLFADQYGCIPRHIRGTSLQESNQRLRGVARQPEVAIRLWTREPEDSGLIQLTQHCEVIEAA